MHSSEKTWSTTFPTVRGKLPVFAELPTPHSVKTQMVFSARYVLSVNKWVAFNIGMNFHLIFIIPKKLLTIPCPFAQFLMHNFTSYLSQTHTLRDNKTEGTYRDADSQFGDVFQPHTARVWIQ